MLPKQKSCNVEDSSLMARYNVLTGKYNTYVSKEYSPLFFRIKYSSWITWLLIDDRYGVIFQVTWIFSNTDVDDLKSHTDAAVNMTAINIIIIIIIMSVMDLGHLLTRSGLTNPKVSSKVFLDSFCQLGNILSLPWVTYYEAFYLNVVSSSSCIPVFCPRLVLFLIPLQFVYLFCNLPMNLQKT